MPASSGGHQKFFEQGIWDDTKPTNKTFFETPFF
jgi:hypothetical protein